MICSALLVVENNSVGFAVLDKLKEMQYPNLYHSIKSTHQFVEEYQADQMSNAVVGFSMTSKTRPLIVAKLEECMALWGKPKVSWSMCESQ